MTNQAHSFGQGAKPAPLTHTEALQGRLSDLQRHCKGSPERVKPLISASAGRLARTDTGLAAANNGTTGGGGK